MHDRCEECAFFTQAELLYYSCQNVTNADPKCALLEAFRRFLVKKLDRVTKEKEHGHLVQLQLLKAGILEDGTSVPI